MKVSFTKYHLAKILGPALVMLLAITGCSNPATETLGEGSEPTRVAQGKAPRQIDVPISDATTFLGFVTTVLNNPGEEVNGNLLADITLPLNSFAPIGTKDDPYLGTFEGNGHSITYNMERTTGMSGLFGHNEGTIQNLTVQGTLTVKVTSPGDYIGGVAAYNGLHGTIQDVKSYVTVVGSGEDTHDPPDDATYNVGGITGFNGMDTINADSPDEGKPYAQGGLIQRCANYGNVMGYEKIGGIAGQNAGNIFQCFNQGKIDSMNASRKNGVGGIAGRNGDNSPNYPDIDPIQTGIIIDSYNIGTIGIADQKWVGGITGFNNTLSYVYNCYDVGAIASTSGFDNPIVGRDDTDGGPFNTYIYNNYSLDSISYTGNTQRERGEPKTDSELKDAGFPAVLGPNWKADYASTPVNNGYPILIWQ